METVKIKGDTKNGNTKKKKRTKEVMFWCFVCIGGGYSHGDQSVRGRYVEFPFVNL